MSHVVCPRCSQVNRLPRGKPALKAVCGSCKSPLFTGEPLSVNESSFGRHIERNDIPVLVDMWAPWCGPCRAMAPMFEKAAQMLEPHVRLLKLNVDEAPATAARFGVRGIPALLLFKDQRVVAQSAGVQNAEAISAWVQAHAPTSFVA